MSISNADIGAQWELGDPIVVTMESDGDGDGTDGTDGGDSDGTDGGDSDGTDGTDGDGTDG
jgi:hypothetical protein